MAKTLDKVWSNCLEVIKDIVESKNLLLEKRFPVIFREMKESGKEYFDEKTFRDFLNWMDSLDRL